MDRWNGVSRGIALVVGLLLMARPVCAQTTSGPARPYRALFGGDASNQRSRHQVDLTLSMQGGTDNGLAAPVAAPPNAPTGAAPKEFSELFSGSAQMSYAMRGRSVGVGAGGSVSYPYYSIFPDIQDLAYGSSANASYVSGPTSLSAFGSFAYSPYYSPALTPGYGGPVDYAAALSPNESLSSGASWTQRFGRQTSMTAAYSLSGVLFTDEDRSNRSQYAQLSASRQMTKSTSINGGYAYSASDYSGSAQTASNSQWFNLGVGYNHRSSRGLGTSVALSAGGSIVDYLQRYHLWHWSLSFSRAISANWTVGAGYNRSLENQNVLQQPVWADVARATVTGRSGRRVQLSFAALYSKGWQLESASSPRYDIYSGTARVQVALAESLAVTADYIYYRYNYPAGYDLPEGVPQHQDRQRVLVGARFWLPLLRAGRAGEPRPAASQ